MKMKTTNSRLVITGMGAVTPIGIGVENYWKNLVAGKCGVEEITRFDTEELPVKIAAEVKDFNAEDFMPKKLTREMDVFMQYGYAAAMEAIADAGEEITVPERMGIVVGTALGGISPIAEVQDGLSKGEHKKVSPRFVPKIIGNEAAAQVAIAKGYRGPSLTVSTACSSGGDAISTACMLIMSGQADAVLAMGTESALSPLFIQGLASAHALSTNNENPQQASRPFDKDRDGFVIGEGGGALIIETEENAKKRGAKIYAEVVGYGANCDAYHFTAPAPGGTGGAACMRLALADGGVEPEQIGYINAHGTSTHLNDSCETAAIKTVFGGHAYKLAVSSTKSMTGHLLGGAGGVEGVFTALALHDAFLPATVNLQEPDPELDLDYIPNHGRAAQVEYAMSDSLGFGGHNACVVFKRWEG